MNRRKLFFAACASFFVLLSFYSTVPWVRQLEFLIGMLSAVIGIFDAFRSRNDSPVVPSPPEPTPPVTPDVGGEIDWRRFFLYCSLLFVAFLMFFLVFVKQLFVLPEGFKQRTFARIQMDRSTWMLLQPTWVVVSIFAAAFLMKTSDLMLVFLYSTGFMMLSAFLMLFLPSVHPLFLYSGTGPPFGLGVGSVFFSFLVLHHAIKPYEGRKDHQQALVFILFLFFAVGSLALFTRIQRLIQGV